MLNRYAQYGISLKNANGVPFQSSLMFVNLLYSGIVKWHKVDISENCRPDLIAYKWYSDASFWPFIAWYNNIKDPLTGFANIIQQKDADGNPIFQTDLFGNYLFDLNNQLIPVMIPNVLAIPTEKSKLTNAVIPRVYQQVG